MQSLIDPKLASRRSPGRARHLVCRGLLHDLQNHCYRIRRFALAGFINGPYPVF